MTHTGFCGPAWDSSPHWDMLFNFTTQANIWNTDSEFLQRRCSLSSWWGLDHPLLLQCPELPALAYSHRFHCFQAIEKVLSIFQSDFTRLLSEILPKVVTEVLSFLSDRQQDQGWVLLLLTQRSPAHSQGFAGWWWWGEEWHGLVKTISWIIWQPLPLVPSAMVQKRERTQKTWGRHDLGCD